MLPLPTVDHELPHGFTIRRVNGIAAAVVWTRLRTTKTSGDKERLSDYAHAVRVALVERLYLDDEKPAYEDLLREGQRAIGAFVDSDNRFRGITRDRRLGEYRINNGYMRFWRTSGAPTQSPEESIVERQAIHQILATLRPSHRQVLEALAQYDDYGLAAESLGKSRKTFTTQVGQARKEFLELWHEGELPSRTWGRDRRKIPGSKNRASATYVINRRRREKERAKSEADMTA